jgi:hypothetical protein
MEKNSKNKDKKMSKDLASKLNNKGFYIQSNYCKYFIDSNNNGDLFLNRNDSANQKWEFHTPDTPGEYFLKNTSTGFYLSTNDYGDLFTDIQIMESSYQRWKIHITTDADNYTIINKANNFIIGCNKTNKIIMKSIDINPLINEKLDFNYVFTFMAKKAVKK